MSSGNATAHQHSHAEFPVPHRNRNADESDTQSRVSLNPICSECLDPLKNRLAAIFAGSLATEYLFPKEHRPYDAQFDQARIDREFSYFPILPASRVAIEKASKVRGRVLICQEREAILALTEALVVGNGALGGEGATRVVVEHLGGNPSILMYEPGKSDSRKVEEPPDSQTKTHENRCAIATICPTTSVSW